MSKDHNTKTKNVDDFQVPDELWAVVESLLPPPPERKGPGRSRADDRQALNGIYAFPADAWSDVFDCWECRL